MTKNNAVQFLIRIMNKEKLFKDFLSFNELKQKEIIEKLDLDFSWNEFKNMLDNYNKGNFEYDKVQSTDHYDKKIEDFGELIANIHLTY